MIRRKGKQLQTGTMKRLGVNNELTTMIRDDLDSDAATTSLEGFRQAGPEVGLVKDGNGLLDIACLSHCNNGAILEIKNTVLLEDRS